MELGTLGLLLSFPRFPHSDTLYSSIGFPGHHRLPFFSNRVIVCSAANSKPQPPPSQPMPPFPPLPGLSLRSISDWADAIKERGMQRRRYLYTHEKWVEHRSSRRHVRHVASSFSSRVILSLIPPVLVFTSVAALVAAYNSAVSLRLLPEFLPLLHAPALPYQLTAPALALLLVFRTEASYSRFEEARRTWAKVIAGTRDLARAAAAWVSLPEDEHIRDAIIQYVMAFPLALKVGVLIEEPFPVLPLAELCNLACESIRESLATEESIRRQLQSKRKFGSGTSTARSPNGWPMSEQDPS